MLESIRTLTDIPGGNAERFAREDLAAARHRRRLLDEARRRASQCIAEANAEAQVIRTYAFQEGYGHGILQASADMTDLLVRSRTLATQLNHDLARAAEQLLSELLQQDPWLEQALSHWLSEQKTEVDGVLHVLLPMRCKGRGTVLAERLRERWKGPLSIEYQDQERYLLRLADQVLEFDIDSIQADLTPRLLARLRALPEAVRQLDEGVIQALRQQFDNGAGTPASPYFQPEPGSCADVD
jgi:hypothetical protein